MKKGMLHKTDCGYYVLDENNLISHASCIHEETYELFQREIVVNAYGLIELLSKTPVFTEEEMLHFDRMEVRAGVKTAIALGTIMYGVISNQMMMMLLLPIVAYRLEYNMKERFRYYKIKASRRESILKLEYYAKHIELFINQEIFPSQVLQMPLRRLKMIYQNGLLAQNGKEKTKNLWT